MLFRKKPKWEKEVDRWERQEKTSVLDAIAWALGGEKHRPSQAQRSGSTLPQAMKIIMDNGLVVERKGKNSDLKVTDPTGKKAGQTLLKDCMTDVGFWVDDARVCREVVEKFWSDIPGIYVCIGELKNGAE